MKQKGKLIYSLSSGKFLEYMACEGLNSSYISIRVSDWSCVEGYSKQPITIRSTYTVIMHYGICALVPLHFAGKSYSGIAKCRYFG